MVKIINQCGKFKSEKVMFQTVMTKCDLDDSPPDPNDYSLLTQVKDKGYNFKKCNENEIK